MICNHLSKILCSEPKIDYEAIEFVKNEYTKEKFLEKFEEAVSELNEVKI